MRRVSPSLACSGKKKKKEKRGARRQLCVRWMLERWELLELSHPWCGVVLNGIAYLKEGERDQKDAVTIRDAFMEYRTSTFLFTSMLQITDHWVHSQMHVCVGVHVPVHAHRHMRVYSPQPPEMYNLDVCETEVLCVSCFLELRWK